MVCMSIPGGTWEVLDLPLPALVKKAFGGEGDPMKQMLILLRRIEMIENGRYRYPKPIEPQTKGDQPTKKRGRPPLVKRGIGKS